MYGTQKISVVFKQPINAFNKTKQRSNIAPNFIHSLDASHLALTVNRFFKEVENPSFASVHDSYATHACDVEKLQSILREEFVNIHKTNQLENFKHQIHQQYPDIDLPDVPKEGDLDIHKVIHSKYFFS